jgi:hypothetical protein
MSLKPKVYFSLDFEKLNAKWWTCALILVGADGHLIDSLQTGWKHQSSSSRDVFWSDTNQARAFEVNSGIAGHRKQEEAEQQVVAFVRNAKRAYPFFFAVSDNPTFDVAMLDHILEKYGEPSLCQRTPTVYLQVLCTWSYKLACARSNGSSTATFTFHPATVGIHHTPLYDALCCIEQFQAMEKAACPTRRFSEHYPKKRWSKKRSRGKRSITKVFARR